VRRRARIPGPGPILAVVLTLGAGLAACGEADPPEAAWGPPAARQAARAHEALAARAPELRADLSHRALLEPVPAAESERRLAHVGFERGAEGLWVGSGGRVEPHGGGVLDFLLRAWRPGGRPSRPDDAFPFANGPLALGELYASHRRQVFLPEDASRPPRMRFVLPDGRGGTRIVERDAFYLLGLLVAREADPSATWTNGVGQALSVDRLLGRVLAVDRAPPPPLDADLDHGRLHAVELLLAWRARRLDAGRAEPFDPEALRDRLLAVDPCRAPEGDASPEAREREVECLAHRVESLGRLADEPAVRWSPEDAARVVRLLEALETGALRDPRSVDVAHLVHFALGLDRLRASAPR